MKFNFKKVASVLASTIMLSSTVGFAAAASTYPAPFVTGGTVQGAIVVGASAAPSDFFAALDVQKNLNALAAPSTSTSTTTSVTGGDSVNLASSSQRLYYNSTLNAAKTSIGKSEMKTLLKDGSVEDDAGTTYTYTQSITLGTNEVEYGSPGDLKDPELIVQGTTSVSDPLYTYKVAFNKNINISSDDVRGNEIELFGKKFTVGSNSNSDASPVLYLFGSGQSVTLNEGEETTVKVGDTDHTVKIVAVTQPTTGNAQVSVSVDGGTVRKISEGASSRTGGLDIYAKVVTYSAKDTTTNSATLNIGSSVLKLQSGQTVYVGTDEDSIQNTAVVLTTSNGKLSSIAVNVSMQDSDTDFIQVGKSFTDPVFGGLKLNFASVNPALDSTSRQAIAVATDGNRNTKVTFDSALEDSTGAFTYVHDNDTSTATVTPILSNNDGDTIHVIENEAVYKNQYMIVGSGDYGRIVRLDTVPTGSLSTGTPKVRFVDAISGEEWVSASIDAEGHGSSSPDGQTYYFNVTNGTSATSNVKVTWGAGSSYNVAGSATSVFPRIKLKNGGWLALLTQVTLVPGTTYSLPGAETLATYETGQTLPITLGDGNITRMKFGNVNYTITGNSASNATAVLNSINTNADNTADCIFNTTNGPAILLMEPKKTSETGNSDNGDVICVASSTYGTSTKEVAVAQPVMTGITSGWESWDSDDYLTSAVTRYGTFLKYNSQDNAKADIALANEQMYADVLFTSEGAIVIPGTTTGGGAGGTVSIVRDNEVDSVKAMNLFVVGGSCINSVAAKVLGSESPLCGDDFSAKTKVSSGGYIIQTVASPYTEGKVAMLVAGYNAADTESAVQKALTGVSTDVGSTTTYPEVAAASA